MNARSWTLVLLIVSLFLSSRVWGIRRAEAGDADPFEIHILVFADNVWLIANDPANLQEMYQAWRKVLAKYGWTTDTADCKWATTAPDDDWQDLSVKDERGNSVPRVPAATGFKVLGAMITFDATDEVELTNRLEKTWK